MWGYPSFSLTFVYLMYEVNINPKPAWGLGELPCQGKEENIAAFFKRGDI